MPEHGIRNSLSLCPFQIFADLGGGRLSCGTAFFYEHADEDFLITNWHVVTGRDPFTKAPLYPLGGFPDHIMAKFFVPHPDGTRLEASAYRVDIYDGSRPRWYEHPDLGSNCDVVALPFTRPESCPPQFHRPANKESSIRVPVTPGGTVFIIGFPQAISVSGGLPVWKSGYIASEPHFPVTIGGNIAEVGGLEGGMTIPAFFLDSQTRSGMSGSPVFAAYSGTWNSVDPYAPGSVLKQEPKDIRLGAGFEFVGCYSGRALSSENEAALGLCWRTDVNETICSARVLGANPHPQEQNN